MTEDLLSKLNEEQRTAVTHVNGPLMIVAGAGTGKTTVVAHRISYLIDQGHAKPEEILALTFTDKAAGEMEERVDQLLPYGYVDLSISTFHSFAEKLLRQYGAELGLSRDFRLMTELDAWLLTRQNFDRFELDHYRPLGNPTKYIRSLLSHFSRAKDVGVGPEDYRAFVEAMPIFANPNETDDAVLAERIRLTELAGAYTTYQNILLEHDTLDFGDLMLYTLALLKKRPAIRDQIRARFRFVLVDEFQDTNDAQYEIVKLIAEPKRNLTVVGDDDQSIYKFRGASLANILKFEEDFPEAKRVVLTKNYRSAQEILDTAHRFIQHNNPNRLEASSERNLSKKLEACTPHAAEIHHLHALTAKEEVASVVRTIEHLKSSQPETNWSDFAILVRSNAAGTDFATALERHQIPYQFLALSGLYTKPPVLDLLAYLRVIDHAFDSASLYRVLTSPIAQVGERSVMELNQEASKSGKSLFEVCERVESIEGVSKSDQEKITTLLVELKELQEQARTRPVGEMFVICAKESGYLEYLNQLSEQKKLDHFGYLQQFYQRLKSFEQRNEHPILHHFLKEFTHERDAGEEGSLSVDMESGPDVVRIMTIHASKGLEFKYVFIVNLVAQRFPTNTKSDAIPLPEGMGAGGPDKDAHLEEERRLFYVAITRAKCGLYFTSAEDYGGSRARKLSRFLHELGYDSPISHKETLEIFDEDIGTPTKEDQKVVNYPIPKQFSFTQLAAFKTCPLQYKFAHILKVPVKGKWTFSYGKTMHHTLQHFFQLWMERTQAFVQPQTLETLPVSQDELFELFRTSWLDDWYENDKQREEYRSQGEETLKGFYRNLEKDVPTPLFIEQPFKIKFGEIVLKGQIDRIDQCEDGVEIIDYKTGKPKTRTSITKDDKEQLFLYQLAARDVLGLVPKKLTFHYLQDNSRVSFLGSDSDLLDVQESVVNRVQSILSSNFDPTPGFDCQFCDFADICEYRQ